MTILKIRRLLNKNEKMLKVFLVQGPRYTKKPLGHRDAYPTLIKTNEQKNKK